MENCWVKGVDLMFLHLGKDITILEKDIIAIIDKKTIENSKNTQKFIDMMKRDGYLYNNIDNAKTYILAYGKRGYCLYMSNISSITLSKRNKNIETGLEVNNQ